MLVINIHTFVFVYSSCCSSGFLCLLGPLPLPKIDDHLYKGLDRGAFENTDISFLYIR